jgi:hypothetical protein
LSGYRGSNAILDLGKVSCFRHTLAAQEGRAALRPVPSLDSFVKEQRPETCSGRDTHEDDALRLVDDAPPSLGMGPRTRTEIDRFGGGAPTN